MSIGFHKKYTPCATVLALLDCVYKVFNSDTFLMKSSLPRFLEKLTRQAFSLQSFFQLNFLFHQVQESPSFLILIYKAFRNGVAESSYECQFCIYPKVSLSPGFKNSIKEDSYPKSATPQKSTKLNYRLEPLFCRS